MSKRPEQTKTQTLETLVEEAMTIGASPQEVHQIHDSVKRHPLPANVRSFEVNFGRDSTGDPAMWIWFLVDNDNNPSKEKIDELNRFANSVRSDLLKANLRYWPYVDFRAAS